MSVIYKFLFPSKPDGTAMSLLILALRILFGVLLMSVCLMDMGTIGAKWLKKNGILTGLDESEEINACTVKVKVYFFVSPCVSHSLLFMVLILSPLKN